MWRRINKIGWTIWSWPNFATTIRSIRQWLPPPFKWWWASLQFRLQRGPHMDNPQVMQEKKCWWSHNLMKKGGACGSWPRPTWKKHTNNTKTLWSSPDERWVLKKEMKCGWTSKKFSCQKVWTTSSSARMWVHSKCWKRKFLTLTN